VIKSGSDNYVDRVTGIHLSGYSSNSQVKVLQIDNQQITSLPKGIAHLFPNLDYLQVFNSQLKTISKDDLVPFPNLKMLSLDYNQLETLDGDLLVGNPNLWYINFGNNKIKNVGFGLLNSLTKLTTIYFKSNTCISKYAESATQIESLKQYLATECPPTIDAIILKVNKLEKNLELNIQESATLKGQLELSVKMTAALEKAFTEFKAKAETTAAELRLKVQKLSSSLERRVSDLEFRVDILDD